MGMTAIVGQKKRFYLCNVNERKRRLTAIIDMLRQTTARGGPGEIKLYAGVRYKNLVFGPGPRTEFWGLTPRLKNRLRMRAGANIIYSFINKKTNNNYETNNSNNDQYDQK